MSFVTTYYLFSSITSSTLIHFCREKLFIHDTQTIPIDLCPARLVIDDSKMDDSMVDNKTDKEV